MEIIQKFEDSTKNFHIDYVTVQNDKSDVPTIWFMAKPVAEFLEYSNTAQAIRKNVEKGDRKSAEELKVLSQITLPDTHLQTIFINQDGLTDLILSSKKTEAKKFRHWVTHEVIPSILMTGQYKYKPYVYKRPNCALSIQSENDLHYAVVNFLREMCEKKNKHIMWHAGIGEIGQTPEIRKDITCKGYMKGQPDLVIINPTSKYSGYALEFKNPKNGGHVADEQIYMMEQYRKLKYKVLISNDLFEIISKLTSYIKNIRLPCTHCNGKFKTNETLKNHLVHFHHMTQNVCV
jgi:prophage antirepressor-like protein